MSSEDIQVPIMTMVEKYRAAYDDLHYRFVGQAALIDTLQDQLDKALAELKTTKPPTEGP